MFGFKCSAKCLFDLFLVYMFKCFKADGLIKGYSLEQTNIDLLYLRDGGLSVMCFLWVSFPFLYTSEQTESDHSPRQVDWKKGGEGSLIVNLTVAQI